MQRTPKNYDGIASPAKTIGELIPEMLSRIQKANRVGGVVESWPEIIGPKMAPMARALSFEKGVLTVLVRSSTLYSLLCRARKTEAALSIAGALSPKPGAGYLFPSRMKQDMTTMTDNKEYDAVRLRCLKASRRCASAPACTSGIPMSPACISSSTRSSTTHRRGDGRPLHADLMHPL